MPTPIPALAAPSLAPDELPARLAAGATVVAASRRLARSLLDQFDVAQRAAGLDVWPAADCLPWQAWLARCWAELDQTTSVLDPLAERVAWEKVVGDWAQSRPLLAPAALAETAQQAWGIAQAWDLAPRLAQFHDTEDQGAMGVWASEFEALLARRGEIELARLPQSLCEQVLAGALAVPSTLIVAGFDLFTPAQLRLLQSLREAGTEVLLLAPRQHQAAPVLVACRDARAELAAAADWARDRLNRHPGARIAVVVPDLAERRAAVAAQFSRSLAAAAGAAPFNISLGVPLADTGLADTALATLELVAGEVALSRACAWLRSPYLGGADSELAARAMLDVWLRERGEPALHLGRLRRAATRPEAATPQLARRLAAMAEWQARWLGQRLPPSAWVEPIFDLFGRADLPGEAPLDSAQWQAWQRLRELLAALARIDGISPRLSLAALRSQWRRWLNQTLFQPEGSDAPVQVLGLLEAAPLDFDHLWVCGLTEAQWPAPARPNPLLPILAQRAAGVPGATPESALATSRRLLATLRRAAPEVVFSWPRHAGDEELAPTALVADLPALELEALQLPAAPLAQVALAAQAPALERLVDTQGPPLADNRLDGGATPFRDQAACPFRAFAAHRLRARPLAEPEPGLAASERGGLLHRALAQVWAELGDSDRLAASTGEEIAALVAHAADAALNWLRGRRELSDGFVRLESERLARVMAAWLELERSRPRFAIQLIEESISTEFAGLQLKLRPDRVDRLPDGRLVILDYKTGRPSPAAWFGDRPDEPQLPLYSLLLDAPVVALAFAQIRPGDNGFKGVAEIAELLPKIGAWDESPAAAEHGSWQELKQRWRETLLALATDFAAGAAAVDPKRPPETCTWCQQQPFCRIHEKIAFDAGSLEETEHGAE